MLTSKRRTASFHPALWSAVLLSIAAGSPARAQLPENWKSEPIGSASGSPGSAQVSNGVWTITGAGADVWGTSDGFQFTYTTLQGDGGIIARVLELPGIPGNPAGTANAAKAGVMLRENTDPGARHLSANQMAKRGVEVTFRLQPGGITDFDGGQLFVNPPPVWLRVQRAGTAFTAFASSDGKTWSQIGKSHTLEMGNASLAGLIVSAVTAGATSPEPITARFDNVSTTSEVLAPGPASLTVGAGDQSALLSWTGVAGATGYNVYRRAASEAAMTKVNTAAVTETTFRDTGITNGSQYVYAVSSLAADGKESALSPVSIATPAPLGAFLAADIGIVTPGSASLQQETITVRGAGRDIGGTNAVSDPDRDELRFVFQQISGDATIVARLKAGPTPPDLGPLAGLMIRESLDPSARQMSVLKAANGGVKTIFRTTAGAPAGTAGGDMFQDVPSLFLRLERKGDTIRASVSADGQTWQPVGGDQQFSGLGANLYVGLAVNGHYENSFAEAQFDNVAITQ